MFLIKKPSVKEGFCRCVKKLYYGQVRIPEELLTPGRLETKLTVIVSELRAGFGYPALLQGLLSFLAASQTIIMMPLIKAVGPGDSGELGISTAPAPFPAVGVV